MLKAVASKLATIFLSLVDLSEFTGVAIAKLRRMAKQYAWTRKSLSTGRRGRPPVAFLVGDVMKSLGLTA